MKQNVLENVFSCKDRDLVFFTHFKFHIEEINKYALPSKVLQLECSLEIRVALHDDGHPA